MNEIILNMVNKTMDCYVLLALVEVIIVIATFDLWMSCEGFDTFALVVNYIHSKWEPCHITIGIFEVHETSIVAMVLRLKDLLTHFDLCDKVITYVKDESAI
jgi:hypothetical protein